MSGAGADRASSMDDTAASLIAFLSEVGDAPEVLWSASIALLGRALEEAGERRFRHHPRGQLRRLREELARGLKLAGLAVAMNEALAEQDRGLAEELSARASEVSAARRRAQTLPAQLARLEKQRRARAGLPVENFHLRADYPREGRRS